MQELENGAFIRPDNLTGGVNLIRERLQSLGLESNTPVFLARQLDDALDSRARALWGNGKLEEKYAHMQRILEHSTARCAAMPLNEAARETYLLGDEAVRQIVFDPLLPEPLVAESKRRYFRDVVKQYDEAGHRIWRDFLASA
ncbi:hypothetical protein D3C85_1498170 [compost metagenome]